MSSRKADIFILENIHNCHQDEICQVLITPCWLSVLINHFCVDWEYSEILFRCLCVRRNHFCVDSVSPEKSFPRLTQHTEPKAKKRFSVDPVNKSTGEVIKEKSKLHGSIDMSFQAITSFQLYVHVIQKSFIHIYTYFVHLKISSIIP